MDEKRYEIEAEFKRIAVESALGGKEFREIHDILSSTPGSGKIPPIVISRIVETALEKVAEHNKTNTDNRNMKSENSNEDEVNRLLLSLPLSAKQHLIGLVRELGMMQGKSQEPAR